MASRLGILTVGVVTKPFLFEGAHRSRAAEAGLQELERAVDAMIVVPNQNLFRLADRATPLLGAFKLADDVLYGGREGGDRPDHDDAELARASTSATSSR